LAISQLLNDLILLEVDELKDALAPAYKILLNLYFEFKENSFLQYVIESIFKNLFKQMKTDDFEKGTTIKNIFGYWLKILQETDLLNLIAEDSINNSRFKYRSQREQRHCHIAFNTEIAKAINDSIK